MSRETRSIYKYCSSNVARLILDNNLIKLNAPSSFNDPYDAKVLFDEKDLRISSDIVMNYFGELAMRKNHRRSL